MNSTKKYSLLFLSLVCLGIFVFVGCQDNLTVDDLNEETNLTSRILEKETPLDDLTLPAGSKVTQVSDSQIDIDLPNGYEFLLHDENDGVSYSSFGSYTCTCSASGSCKAFHAGEEGYGCLQSSCSGSCTGTPSSGGGIKRQTQVYGILNVSTPSLVSSNFVDRGSLTEEGYDIFFNKVAHDELKGFFDLAYLNTGYKNAEEYLANEGEEKTSHVLLQFKGISFSAVIPNVDQAGNSFASLISGPSVSCAGSNGCSCAKDKRCFLGNCVYFCEGCTTCTITVNEK